MEKVSFYIWHLLFCNNTIFKGGTIFHQISIEGNIASGKTTCLDYFAQTTNIEVLDLHFFIFIYITKRLHVLTKLTVNSELLFLLRLLRKKRHVVSQCTYYCKYLGIYSQVVEETFRSRVI